MGIGQRFDHYYGVNYDRLDDGKDRLGDAEIAYRVFVDVLMAEGYTRPDAEAAYDHLVKDEDVGPPGDTPEQWVEDALPDARRYLAGRRDRGSRRPPSVTRQTPPHKPPPRWFEWYSHLVNAAQFRLQREALRSVGRVVAGEIPSPQDFIPLEQIYPLLERTALRWSATNHVSSLVVPYFGSEDALHYEGETWPTRRVRCNGEIARRAETVVRVFDTTEEAAVAFLLSNKPLRLTYLESSIHLSGIPPLGRITLRVHPSVTPNQVRDEYIRARNYGEQASFAGPEDKNFDTSWGHYLEMALLDKAPGGPFSGYTPSEVRDLAKSLIFEGLQVQDQTFELLLFVSEGKERGLSWGEIYREWDQEHPDTYTLRSMQQTFYKYKEVLRAMEVAKGFVSENARPKSQRLQHDTGGGPNG